MNHILDKINGIPYYTDNIDQLFSWYTIYNDSVIISELNKYSGVNFNSIPKQDISHFGLFGCGFHLDCDFNSYELSIYQSYKDNEYLYSNRPSIQENNLLILNDKSSFKIQNVSPFTFKHYVLETEFNKTSSRCFIDQYYAGYTGLISLNETKIIFKMYFSIHIYDHPDTIGIVYKFFPYEDTQYQDKNYRFELAENMCTILNGKHKISKSSKGKIINFKETKGYYRNKTIFSYR